MAYETHLTKRCHTIGDYCLDAYSNNTNQPILIFVHGIGASGRYFLPLAHTLAKQFQVIVVDLPGSGDTTKPDEALSIHELADVLGEFIDQQQLSDVTLIGHSMGCQTISMLAAKRPDICKNLILIAPTINNAERSAPKQFLRLLQDTTREPLDVNTILFSDYLKFGFFRYLRTQSYMINDTLEIRADECPQPTLLIRGSKDAIAPKQWVQELENCFQDATSHTLPGYAHAVQFTAAKQVAALCQDFIDAH